MSNVNKFGHGEWVFKIVDVQKLYHYHSVNKLKKF